MPDPSHRWAEQGRASDAHLMAVVYQRFTQGYETTDVTAAAQLLAELEAGGRPS